MKSLLSPYLDGALNGAERQQVSAHMQTCVVCMAEYAALSRTQELMIGLGRKPAPPDLALQLRVALSQEMSMTWERRLQRAMGRFEESINAFMLPATGGLVTALVMFGLLIGGFMTLPRAVAGAGTDVPTSLYTPPKLTSAPFADYMVVQSDTPVVIEALVDSNGRLQDYRIIAGQDSTEIRKQLDRSLIFTVFEPAMSFGQRAPGKVVLTFANVDVKG
ncbi:MAG TPA: zf-HC2 domain-containing protein [Terriglobales bacterium]|nr:zf-HC2 domain-containing protein [Terriglobales bacterium]